MASTTTKMAANVQRIVGRSLMTRSEKASMKNRNKVSSGVISAESIAVPKLGRRSVSDRWIPFKFPERRRTVRSDCRQEECRRGGQISGVRSEHKFRPSLDQGEPARSLKCKEKRVYKILKEGGPSIYGQDTWTQINISLTGKSKV
jgi:hypothetical protein